MTHKPIKTNNMSIISIVCLSLLVTVTVAKIESYASATVLAKIPARIKFEKPYVMKELMDDHRIAVFTHDPFFQSTQPFVQIIGANNTKTKCLLPRMNITWPKPAKRVSPNNVLVFVKGDQKDQDGESKVKPLLVNTKNCKYTFAYDKQLPFMGYTRIFSSENSTDERFVMIVQGKEYCEGYEWCKLHFDPVFQKLEPLHFDFSYHHGFEVEPVGTFDSNIFIVRYVDEDGTRITSLHQLVGRDGTLNREISSIDRDWNNPGKYTGDGFYWDFLNGIWFAKASSGLSDCWRPDHSTNTVRCSRFAKNWSLMFNEDVDYPEEMRPLGISTISNGLMLFTVKQNCAKMDDCSNLQVTIITGSSTTKRLKSQRIQKLQYDIKCSPSKGFGSSFRVQENESDGSFEVQYLCDDEENYTYGTFYIPK